MKKYKIPVKWKMYGVYSVNASSLKEAKTIVLNETSLPQEASFVQGSLKIISLKDMEKYDQ